MLVQPKRKSLQMGFTFEGLVVAPVGQHILDHVFVNCALHTERFKVHWPVMVRSEIRHPRLPRQRELRSASRAELPRDSSTTDVSTVFLLTTREERDPTSVPAESSKTSPSDKTLSVSSAG